MLDRILAPIDGSEQSEPILPYVEELARRLNSSIVLLHVYPPSLHRERNLHSRYIQSLAERVVRRTSNTVEVEGLAIEGTPNEEIVKYANRDDVSLIAAAPHSQKSAGRWTIGRTADKVIRETSKPVLLASGLTEAVARTDRLLTQPLVPLDGSHASRAVLPFAEAILAGLPRNAPGGLTLLHVIPSDHYAAGPLIARRVPFAVDEMARLRSQAKQYLEEVSRGIRGRNILVEVHVAVGDPAVAITNSAIELKADFIAMTTHGLSGFSRLFLGSVADRVLHTSTTPLLLLKPTAS